nr:MAG TPA: hypothetical protein [Caudoviricetes sp.]
MRKKPKQLLPPPKERMKEMNKIRRKNIQQLITKIQELQGEIY